MKIIVANDAADKIRGIAREFKFPDDTRFQFNQPCAGWLMLFLADEKQTSCYFQIGFVIAIVPDDA